MTKANILIHPGYPKCGSTSLQERVFSRHPELNYLSYNSMYSNPARDVPENLEFHDRLRGYLPPDLDRIDYLWRECVLPAVRTDRLNIISEEKFLNNLRPPIEIAVDIFSVVGPAHVLLVVRDQVDILRSFYDMYPWAPSDSSRRFVSFSQWLDSVLAKHEQHIAPSLRFVDVYAGYMSVFGRQSVTVVSFDRLFGDYQAQTSLCGRLGIRDVKYFISLMAAPAKNTAENHSYKKLVRRVLGPVHASRYLTVKQIAILRSFLSRVLPARKTEVCEADRLRIYSFFEGQQVSDLVQLGGEGMLL